MFDAIKRLIPSWRLSPEDRSLAPGLWEVWRRGLTEAGRLMVIVLVVSGTASLTLIGAGYPLYHFAVFLFVLLLTGRLCGMLFRPRVEVQRTLPERVAAGATVRVCARVTNSSLLPVFDLSITEQIPSGLRTRVRREYEPLALPLLAKGEVADLAYELTFLRRGTYDLGGPQPFTTFPFGLQRSAIAPKAPQRVLVYPRFLPLGRLDLPVGHKHQPGGLQLVSQVGESEEFVGNREYRPGDRMRDLDTRAWARVGFPVVREYQQEYLSRIALVVDTYVSKRRKKRDHAALEAGISLGASVADVLSRREYVIDIFAAGPDLYHFQAGRSLAYFDSILDVLACIEPNHSNPFPVLGPAILESVSQISTAVVVLLDWDEDRRRFLRALCDCGVAVKVVVVRDGPLTLDPSGFASLAGPVTVFTPAQIEAGVDAL